MKDPNSHSKAKIDAFWTKYERWVTNTGVREEERPWYLTRAQEFIRFLNGAPLKETTFREVAAFLNNLRYTRKLAHWQVDQAAEALRILLQNGVNLPWAMQWPWEGVRAGEEPIIEKESAPSPGRRHFRRFKDGGAHKQVETTFADLINQLRVTIRTRHYSGRTEAAYVDWACRYVKFHDMEHPEHLGSESVRQYLEFLAVERQVAPSTQNQALNALVFLYKHVLRTPLDVIGSFPRSAKREKRMPTVLSRDEIKRLMDVLHEPFSLIAGLLYGSGLRLMECVRLRVQDLDFDQNNITVRNGKGDKDRITALPETLAPAIHAQLGLAKQMHDDDLRHGCGEALFKYAPHRRSAETAREWRLQYLFPSNRLSVDPQTRKVYRDHIHHSAVQKAIKTAAREADIARNVTCHSLRHSFATHLLQNGTNIRVIQELMGHRDINTTMVYMHAQDVREEGSLLDREEDIF